MLLPVWVSMETADLLWEQGRLGKQPMSGKGLGLMGTQQIPALRVYPDVRNFRIDCVLLQANPSIAASLQVMR